MEDSMSIIQSYSDSFQKPSNIIPWTVGTLSFVALTASIFGAATSLMSTSWHMSNLMTHLGLYGNLGLGTVSFSVIGGAVVFTVFKQGRRLPYEKLLLPNEYFIESYKVTNEKAEAIVYVRRGNSPPEKEVVTLQNKTVPVYKNGTKSEDRIVEQLGDNPVNDLFNKLNFNYGSFNLVRPDQLLRRSQICLDRCKQEIRKGEFFVVIYRDNLIQGPKYELILWNNVGKSRIVGDYDEPVSFTDEADRIHQIKQQICGKNYKDGYNNCREVSEEVLISRSFQRYAEHLSELKEDEYYIEVSGSNYYLFRGNSKEVIQGSADELLKEEKTSYNKDLRVVIRNEARLRQIVKGEEEVVQFLGEGEVCIYTRSGVLGDLCPQVLPIYEYIKGKVANKNKELLEGLTRVNEEQLCQRKEEKQSVQVPQKSKIDPDVSSREVIVPKLVKFLHAGDAYFDTERNVLYYRDPRNPTHIKEAKVLDQEDIDIVLESMNLKLLEIPFIEYPPQFNLTHPPIVYSLNPNEGYIEALNFNSVKLYIMTEDKRLIVEEVKTTNISQLSMHVKEKHKIAVTFINGSRQPQVTEMKEIPSKMLKIAHEKMQHKEFLIQKCQDGFEIHTAYMDSETEEIKIYKTDIKLPFDKKVSMEEAVFFAQSLFKGYRLFGVKEFVERPFEGIEELSSWTLEFAHKKMQDKEFLIQKNLHGFEIHVAYKDSVTGKLKFVKTPIKLPPNQKISREEAVSLVHSHFPEYRLFGPKEFAMRPLPEQDKQNLLLEIANSKEPLFNDLQQMFATLYAADPDLVHVHKLADEEIFVYPYPEGFYVFYKDEHGQTNFDIISADMKEYTSWAKVRPLMKTEFPNTKIVSLKTLQER